jgi:hypothetical protein
VHESQTKPVFIPLKMRACFEQDSVGPAAPDLPQSVNEAPPSRGTVRLRYD